MARSKKMARRRDWRKIAFWIITLIIALTMVLSSVLLAIPAPN